VNQPIRLLVAALTVSIAPLAVLHAQQSERFELAGTTIKLYNLIGTLQVEAATGGTASAEVTRQGADRAKLTIQNAGGVLRILYPGSQFTYPAPGGNFETSLRVRDDGTFTGDWNDRERGRKVKISSRVGGLTAWADVRLMIPRGARVDVNLGVGKVVLTNINGTIEVETASGNVSGSRTGGSLSVDTGSGDVVLTGHDGSLSVDTGSGDITLSAITTDKLSLDTGSGDVRVDGLTASEVSVDTGSGDVLLSGAAVRVVEIDTGSGDIRIGLTVDIESLSVDTGSGDVVISAPGSLGATVEIETSSGDLNTDFPLQVTR
jgi:hypothetical protein